MGEHPTEEDQFSNSEEYSVYSDLYESINPSNGNQNRSRWHKAGSAPGKKIQSKEDMSQNHKIKKRAAQDIVDDGTYTLTIIELTDTLIRCNPLSNLPAGEYRLNVLVLPEGNALGSTTLTSDLVVDGIGPLSGSIYGGTVVDITGWGFKSTSDIILFINDDGENTATCQMFDSLVSRVVCITSKQEESQQDIILIFSSSIGEYVQIGEFDYSSSMTPEILSLK